MSGKGFSVDGSAAVLSLAKGTRIAAPGVGAADSDALVRVVFPATPSAGLIRAEVLSRATAATAKATWYETDLIVSSDGRSHCGARAVGRWEANAVRAPQARHLHRRRCLLGAVRHRRQPRPAERASLARVRQRTGGLVASGHRDRRPVCRGPAWGRRPRPGAAPRGHDPIRRSHRHQRAAAGHHPARAAGPLSFAGISITGATVSWTPATDDVGVAGYQVSVDGSDAGTTTADFLDLTGLDCGTAYDVAVRASDAAGNVSDPSEGTLTTSSCPDTTRPQRSRRGQLLERHGDHRHRELGCLHRRCGRAPATPSASMGPTPGRRPRPRWR